MEALQLLKYGLKKNRLHFTKHLLTPEEDLTGTDPESMRDLLADQPGQDQSGGALVRKLWGDEVS